MYQDEAEMIALQRDKFDLGLEPNPQETNKTVVHVSPSILGFKIYIPLNFLMGAGCSGLI